MRINEIRQKYFNFFEQKQHRVIASASLLPENDPTTLFTGSGMQPLLPYLLGSPHPEGKRLVDSQKSFRAEDMDEVGDNRHTTFFEMLGNWSLGDYFKEEQLPWLFEFLVQELKLDPNRIYVTVFAGDESLGIPRDTESVKIWQKLYQSVGIDAKDVEILTEERGGDLGMQGGRIFYYNAKKNWWSRAGTPDKMPVGEPGGPDSEVFYEFDIEHDKNFGEYCHPNCDCGRFLEIGNSVFMQYRKTDNGFEQLKQQNVDFGGGLERIAAATENNPDVFAIDALQSIITAIQSHTEVVYATTGDQQRFAFRVIADHVRAAVFLISDGAEPSNKEQGYVVRRLLRRAVRFMDKLGMPAGKLHLLVNPVISTYGEQYPALLKNEQQIVESVTSEESKFRQTLDRGLKELDKLVHEGVSSISGEAAFTLFATYGFPVEMTIELAKEKGLSVDIDAYKKEFATHQEKSKAGITQKFHGGLADNSWETTQGHTATHLLQATLRNILGDHVFQKGSNITQERLRFDFSHPDRLSEEQLDEVERRMAEAIAADYPVTWKEMTFEEATAVGALGLFEERYGEKVKVYSMGDYSHEVCGGPHVEHTSQVQAFKIVKEEAVGRGVRRIKALSGQRAQDYKKA